MTDKALLTVEDVAKLLKVSTATVYELVSDRLIACYRIGTRKGAIRFTEEQVEQYLSACLVTDGKIVQPKKPKPAKLKHLKLD